MRYSRTIFLKIGLYCLSGFLVNTTVQAQQITPFKEADRVVFLGNSITDGGHYHSYIWLYYMTRFPEMNLKVLNAGIGGDRVIEMVKRLDADVFAKQPTVLISTFGMNDSGYFEYNQEEPEKFADLKVQESFNAYQEMEKRFLGLVNTRIVLLGSTPYDEHVVIKDNQPFKNKNNAMKRIVKFQQESAKKNNWEFFDYNESISKINSKFQEKDPSFTISGADRIHPDNNGHMVMAYEFLKAQGFAGKKVAAVHLDAKHTSVLSLENCAVDNIQKTSKSISFDYLANALPYPLDSTARGWGAKYSQYDALKVVPFMEEMNEELLKVSGLKGSYQLKIDEEVIAEFSATALEKGINLSLLTQTPQYQQAIKVMFLNEERWEIERRFRDLAWVQHYFFQPKGLLNADNRKAIEVMDQHVAKDGWLRAKRDLYAKAMHPEIRQAWNAEISMLEKLIYQLNKPIKRRVSLVQISK
ncbi:SGNH/GDSL hydrolase family protein [Sphingobacterium sp. HJSM2_6]|uniref:SGNH/GDSL hydrolase family protein n=1 Tax=Sphingobacterium sp. HJSM2_6 TaxID=3366264 RepID=UPI003BE358B7